MRGLPPVTIRTTERRFRSGPNLLSDLKVLAVDGLAPKWFSFSTTQDSMGNEWITVIYQRLGRTAYYVRGSIAVSKKRARATAKRVVCCPRFLGFMEQDSRAPAWAQAAVPAAAPQ